MLVLLPNGFTVQVKAKKIWYNDKNEKIIATVQDVENDKFKDYICNPKKAMYISDKEVSFKESYDWLVSEMEKRIGKRPAGVSYPIWAWHTRDWKYKKPDLRQAGYESQGTKCVCIEFEIPDNQVVLSDYDTWHFILNDWYFDNSKNEEEWESKHKYYDSLCPEKKLEKNKYIIDAVFAVVALILATSCSRQEELISHEGQGSVFIIKHHITTGTKEMLTPF